MDFNLRTYKHFKTKQYLKTMNYFYFFHGVSLTNKNWIKFEQITKTHKLKYYRILNKLMIKTLRNSIFRNLLVLIHGPIFLLTANKTSLTFQELKNINPWLYPLSFRLNNKIYSKKQVANLEDVSYLNNVFKFYTTIKVFTKMPYYKLEKKKKQFRSK